MEQEADVKKKPSGRQGSGKIELCHVSLNSFAPNPPYILKLSTNYSPASSTAIIASSSSDHTVKLHQFNCQNGSLSYVSELKGHSKPITSIGFIEGEANVLFSSSRDGTLAFWDIRSAKAVRHVNAPRKKPLFSATCTQKVAAGGTEEDVYVWDVGSGKGMMKMEEYHTDEVTSMAFHPGNSSMLFSSGGDGMINQYDLNQSDEDEILEATINCEQPITSFGFFGKSNEFMHILTTMEEVHIYGVEEAFKLISFPDIREKLSKSAKTEINYLVGCQYLQQEDRLYLCSGTSNGGFLVSNLSKDNHLQAVVGLYHNDAHRDVIRDFLWLDSVVITAGEDSKICVWSSLDTMKAGKTAQRSMLPASSAHANHSKNEGRGPVRSGVSRSNKQSHRVNPYQNGASRGRGSRRRAAVNRRGNSNASRMQQTRGDHDTKFNGNKS